MSALPPKADITRTWAAAPRSRRASSRCR